MKAVGSGAVFVHLSEMTPPAYAEVERAVRRAKSYRNHCIRRLWLESKKQEHYETTALTDRGRKEALCQTFSSIKARTDPLRDFG